MHPRIVLAIAKKDIVDAVKNAYVLFALILPVGLSLLFSFMSASGGKDRLLNIVIYDAGQSRLVEQLQANPAVKLIPANSADEVPAQVKDGQLGGLALPADFDAAVAAGKTPELRVYYNGRRSISEQTALRQTMEDALRASAGQTLPARLVPLDVASSGKESAGPDADLAQYLLVMSLVMALIMAGVYIVPITLVEEKEKRTLQAILVSPASYLDLVFGKVLVGMFYSLLLAMLLLLLNKGFAGNAAVTILAVVLGSLFLVQVGLLMGAVFSTTAQVNTWGAIILIALLVPTIFLMPPQPPAPVSTIVRLFPTGQMADAMIIGLSNRASLSNVGLDLLILAGMTVIVSAAVVWALRRERL
jgi:ABC-2 type transport system permease protein